MVQYSLRIYVWKGPECPARTSGDLADDWFQSSGRDVHEICAFLGCYAAPSGSSVPTFRDNVSVPSSRVMGPTRCSETSVQNYYSTLRDILEDSRS
jgi:hypothetical protein